MVLHIGLTAAVPVMEYSILDVPVPTSVITLVTELNFDVYGVTAPVALKLLPK